jgi:hypothetical protein
MTRTLSTTIPGSPLYVSGTVNGVATTWTNTDGDIWETVAERSSDDIYRVELTIINQAGTASTASVVLYYGLHLVTDRVQADVDRVKELIVKWKAGTITEEEVTEWFSELKGAYNAADLNRVGAAMVFLRDKLADAGYTVDIDPKIDWIGGDDDEISDIPTASQMATYLSQVRALRDKLAGEYTALPNSMVNLDFQGANHIEKVLEEIDVLITLMQTAYVYSGEVYGGEV